MPTNCCAYADKDGSIWRMLSKRSKIIDENPPFRAVWPRTTRACSAKRSYNKQRWWTMSILTAKKFSFGAQVPFKAAWARIHFVPPLLQPSKESPTVDVQVSREKPMVRAIQDGDLVDLPVDLPKEAAKVCHIASRLMQPLFLYPRQRLAWWKMNSNNPDVLRVLAHGVCPDWPCPLLPMVCKQRPLTDQIACEKIMEEYLQFGAVKRVNWDQVKFLVPWFIVRKLEANGKEKVRLIADCRLLNSFLTPKCFKLENWRQIFPMLRKGMWASKIDLKHAYFHLGLAKTLQPYVTMLVGKTLFQFQAACFGLSVLPQIFQDLMKVFLKKWRSAGIVVYIYLDDILLLGSSAAMVARDLAILLADLRDAGLLINGEKSTLAPTQVIQHLGFHVDFKGGFLGVPKEKLKFIRRELGKLVTHTSLSCRKMAAILGGSGHSSWLCLFCEHLPIKC